MGAMKKLPLCRICLEIHKVDVCFRSDGQLNNKNV